MSGDPKVYVLPTELWDYCNRNRAMIEDPNSYVVIAEDERRELEIVVKIDSGLPAIAVYSSSLLLREDNIVSKEDAVITTRALYERFLLPDIGNRPQPDATEEAGEDEDEENEDDEDALIEAAIYERESALSSAFGDFLEVALEEQAAIIDQNEIDEVLDEILTSLSDRGFSIYRPTMIGNELIEYPYESEFDSQH